MTREERRRLAGLAEMAGVLRDRSLDELAAAMARVRQVEAEIAGLDRSVAERSAALARQAGLGPADPAAATGVDLAWLAALDRQRARLRMDLARALAASEDARHAASRAVGRSDVLDQLAAGR